MYFLLFFKCISACGILQMNSADFGRVSPMTMENPCYLSTRVTLSIAGTAKRGFDPYDFRKLPLVVGIHA